MLRAGPSPVSPSLTITGSKITGNFASNGDGGGLWLSEATGLDLGTSEVSSNRAQETVAVFLPPSRPSSTSPKARWPAIKLTSWAPVSN
jgi:hypothetical protein